MIHTKFGPYEVHVDDSLANFPCCYVYVLSKDRWTSIVWKTLAIDDEVIVDFERNGDVLGIEVLGREVTDYDIVRVCEFAEEQRDKGRFDYEPVDE